MGAVKQVGPAAHGRVWQHVGVLADADVPAVWASLGLPGLADVHVHFMPERVLTKVWAFFDGSQARTGVAWPIVYREGQPERLARLRALGVRRFPALAYPHKPGMAEWLNDYTLALAAAEPDVVPSATFYPEPGAADYVRRALQAGAAMFKAHVQVGSYDPRDPLLDEVWGLLCDAGAPVVVHCGSGPHPGRFTGPGPMTEVLARHPRLGAVIAHMGLTEYAEMLDLALRYPAVHLDTTMAFTDFTEAASPYPRELLPRLRAAGDRVVLGSDFPNIPHSYAHQVESLLRLDLGEEWLAAVLWHNGARLLGAGRGDRRGAACEDGGVGQTRG